MPDHLNVRYGSEVEMVSRPRHVRSSLKADIRQREWHVRYVPITDISLNSLDGRPIARASTENLVRARIR